MIKPTVRSFDIFDTLIARRYVHPYTIFHQIEQKTGISGFAKLRISAEHIAAQRSDRYGLDEIYAVFRLLEGGAGHDVDALKNAEISTEIDNVIPIQENLDKVREGDILISDMYHSVDTIRQMLAKVGFRKNCGIYLSNYGKGNGSAWQAVKSLFHIERHLGDNAKSDVEMAKVHGISSLLTTVFELNDIETFLTRNGLGSMALLIREARLRQGGDDVIEKQANYAQTHINFPVLTIAAFSIHQLAVSRGHDRVLFCSRDANILVDIFKWLNDFIGPSVDGVYFYANRRMFNAPSTGYLSYFEKVCGNNPLLVDIIGSGQSVASFRHKIERPLQSYYICHTPGEGGDINTTGCMLLNPQNIGGQYFEYLNYATHGTLVDVLFDDSTRNHFPVFENPRYGTVVERSIRSARSVHENLIGIGSKYHMSEIVRELFSNQAKLTEIARILLERLSMHHVLHYIFKDYHFNE